MFSSGTVFSCKNSASAALNAFSISAENLEISARYPEIMPSSGANSSLTKPPGISLARFLLKLPMVEFSFPRSSSTRRRHTPISDSSRSLLINKSCTRT